MIMETASINLLSKGKTVGQVFFGYTKSIYAGKARVSGKIKKDILYILSQGHNVYIPDGPSLSPTKPHPKNWSWIVTVLYAQAKNHQEPMFDAIKIKNKPKTSLFKRAEVPIDGVA